MSSIMAARSLLSTLANNLGVVLYKVNAWLPFGTEIAALGVWKGTGWAMMIFLAALQGVPRELEEAALVDGAGPWRRFRAVTMPAPRFWPACRAPSGWCRTRS